MMPPVVAVAGLSGVGKSTILTRLRSAVPMQVLQASALIKEARTSGDGRSLTLDALRAVDLDENQRLLVEGFAQKIDRTAPLVVLDCHTVIETPKGLIHIDPCVFASMNVKAVVFLEDQPEEIMRRRRDDTTRQRPSTEHLGFVQIEAIQQARTIAAALNIPLFVHRPTGQDGPITERLRSYLTPA
ncbi:ATP-binding protein [Bradyrhizobium amphicarpaeae]|uniref:Adenylate kinase n=1 Tax=Bradyrhizobium amphicarpaeae TaxID=1404768 RepID=A0A2U8PV96_9BRAD|nr:AAA family ATPase [Bradyrhizobium amphicarpaeae]AWM01541.1 adenylate kinase [Bradyrhizobium amphicarpaeae]